MSIQDWNLYVEMNDGSVWAVPVIVIAEHRATYFKKEFHNDLDRSLNEDTLPLFSYNLGEIEEWASREMTWEDVKDFAIQIESAKDLDYSDGWVNGYKEVR